VTGGIAAYKAVLVARLLVRSEADVHVVPTRGALSMVGAPTFEGITGNPVRTEVWEGVDTETHVALARRADVVGVYPATAHTLARFAQGLADDLLTTSHLAATCPVVVAPAMHGEMWAHPATQRNVSTLWSDGVRVVGPASGDLMGGDEGTGRVVEPEVFVRALGEAVAPVDQDLVGRRFTITAAGTRESLDPIRFLGNRSSGRMGFALASAAVRRGATVTLVAGHTNLATPPGVERIDVETASQMRDEVLARADVDVVVKAAAVADFRPQQASERKIKKGEGIPAIELVRNPDILAEIGERRRELHRGPRVLVGFAAETHDVEQYGREKLQRKGADLLVVNDVSREDAGFGSATNSVVLLDTGGGREEIPLAHKELVAHRILDRIAKLLRERD
jgi:phosphopantothenoylcysteine decarboxylase/phosphopantothenate--cysteine ligase